MLGYALFLVPMFIAFVWISSRHGVKQALLDLIAFNLLFSFDFAALLPNDLYLSLLYLLLLVFLGLEVFRLLSSGTMRITYRASLVLSLAIAFVAWMVITAFAHKMGTWSIGRIVNYVARAYILNALFIVVGMNLARGDRIIRFGKTLLLASVLVGIISIIQTASGGTLLTHDTSDFYLGIFQPLGDKATAQRDLYQVGIDFVREVRTIQFGGISFYRAYGTFDGAHVILCFLAIVVFCLLTSRVAVSQWLFVPFIFSVAGLVTAFNRTVIATFVMLSLGVLFAHARSLLSYRVLRRWLLPMSAGLLIGIAYLAPIATVVQANLDGFFGSRAGSQIGTVHGRSLLWEYVFSRIERNPIIGTAEPITLYRARWGDSDDLDVELSAHNSFLDYAYRGGVVPAMILVGLFGFCILRSYGLSRNRFVALPQRTLFFALSTATLGLFILNLTVDWMSVPQVAGLFWIICGYLAAYHPPLNGHN